jgi:hypothetical protein
MEAHLGKNDMEMFYRYLKNINVYFEYGSGGSTYQASILNNIIDTQTFLNKIQKQNKKSNKKQNLFFIISNLRMSICELG